MFAECGSAEHVKGEAGSTRGVLESVKLPLDNFQDEYKTSVCLCSYRASGLCYNLSGDLDLNDRVMCPLSWAASSAQSQACSQVATYEEKGCETSGERKVAHSGLAKRSGPHLGQDYLGSQVVNFTKRSSLSVRAKTIPHYGTKFSHPGRHVWKEAFILLFGRGS